MEAIFNNLTDIQRVETLNNVYQKGISTSAENLAFSSDKLVYVKPFIGRLLNSQNVEDITSRAMIRQVIDELLADIVDEVSLSVSRTRPGKLNKALADYGLGAFVRPSSASSYELRQVA